MYNMLGYELSLWIGLLFLLWGDYARSFLLSWSYWITDDFSLGTFCPWDVLSWDILSMGRFVSGRFYVDRDSTVI